MVENKAEREKPVWDRPYVSVRQGKAQIEIGEEMRSYDPSCATVAAASEFLAEVEIADAGVLCSPSVDYPDSEKDGEIYGANVREWLQLALDRAVTLRKLALVQAARAELTHG